MFILLLLLVLLDESFEQQPTKKTSDLLCLGIYLLSIVIAVMAIVLAIRTFRLKSKVERKYKESAAILDEWERALSLVKSTDDYDVIKGLHIIYALNLASDRLWDRRILEHLMQNTNQQIGHQAKYFYEKLVDRLSQSSSSETPINVTDSDGAVGPLPRL